VSLQVAHLRETEVQDLEGAIGRDDEIAGLQIAVGDAGGVRGRESVQELSCQLDGLGLRRTSKARASAAHGARTRSSRAAPSS
jgi:hypothetical protein